MIDDTAHDGDPSLPDHAIAVIGMSGRFPGATDLDEYWDMLVSGREGSVRYSDQELLDAGVPAELLRDANYSPIGYPLAAFADFDTAVFEMNRSEAEATDPQHRVFLQAAWHALEDAGHAPRSRATTRTGVFAGVSTNDYRDRAAAAPDTHPLQVSIGNDPGMLALRTSYQLDLTGPSLTLQTACSSSLVAVHEAISSLQLHECDLALAGGVAVRFLRPAGHHHEPGSILSTDGHCRPFDADASGTASGDGVGVVVLKRYSDAVADGDRIRAVVLGSAVNNDGARKVGFTAPAQDGQTRVVTEALEIAGVTAADIGYVEAHGTATPLGDPVEVRALQDAYARSPGEAADPASCLLGSVKSNIGHLDAAAGVAGFIKTVRILEQGFVPPTLHWRAPNPACDLRSGPFRVNPRGEALTDRGRPAHAAVSAFGIGGTNAHVILRAAGSPPQASAHRPALPRVVPVSAATGEALGAAATRHADELDRRPGLDLADVAHTLQTGRTPLRHRLAVVANDTASAATALRTAAGHERGPVLRAPSSVFVFPGQGSQYAGMGAALYDTAPVFASVLDDAARVLQPELGWDVREIAFDTTAGSADERLRATEFTQPTVFAIDYALARQLMAWGVVPSALLGHSLGELVAATVAGTFTLPAALRLVARRARLMAGLPAGRMVSVPNSERELVAVLGDDGAEIAAVNADDSCVLSGTAEQIADALARLGLTTSAAVRELRTSGAFHTRAVDGIAGALRAAVVEAQPSPPRIPVLSNVSGSWLDAAQACDPDYWVEQSRRPVRFVAGVRTALELTDATFVEVGPGNAMSTLVTVATADPASSLTTLGRSGDEPRAVLGAVAALWERGADVDWTALPDSGGATVSLPGYPFAATTLLAPPPARVAPRRDAAQWCHVPVWRPAPRRHRPQAEPGTRWLALCDRSRPLAAGLVDLLQRDHDVEVLEPMDPSRLRERVRALRADGFVPDRVLHTWLLGGPSHDARTAAERVAATTADGVGALVVLAQELGEHAIDVAVVTDGLRDVLGEGTTDPERATVLGAAVVLPQEFDGLRVRHVDLEAGAGEHDADAAEILDEILAPTTTTALGPARGTEIALRAGRRFEPAFAPLPVAPEPDGWPAGTYLVTGSSPQAAHFADRLEATGAEVVRAAQVETHTDLIGESRERAGGRFTAVIHADDDRSTGLAATKDVAALSDDLHRVTATLLLDRLCPDEPMLVCASTDGIVGGFGQLQNCAVNQFLDAFGAARTARGSATTTVDWALWHWDDWFEQQMAAMPDVRDDYARRRRAFGIPAAEGVALAAAALAAGLPRLIVSVGELGDVLAGRSDLTATGFADALVGAGSAAGDAHGDARVDAEIDKLFPDDEIAQSVARIWQQVLGVEPAALAGDFYDVGGNSLFAIQIMSRLRKAHGELPMSIVFEAPTVRELAHAIRARLVDTLGSAEFEALLAEIEQLAPDQVEDRLAHDTAADHD